MNVTANMAIRADRLSKSYGKKLAIECLSMTVPEHSITAVLGPNGAGKSTLMRMIAGQGAPGEGILTVLGRTPDREAGRRVAYLPDRARWYPHHTVEQAAEWFGKLQEGFDRERAWGLFDSFGLEAEMKVSGMSRGQEARLMLALCLARDVPLLVLDEPFSGIDMISREKIVGALIDSFAERMQTVLISTHEIAETESLFDRAIFMDRGTVVLEGEAERLRAERGSLQQVYRQLFG